MCLGHTGRLRVGSDSLPEPPAHCDSAAAMKSHPLNWTKEMVFQWKLIKLLLRFTWFLKWLHTRFFTFLSKVCAFETYPRGKVLDPCLGTRVHGYKSSCAGSDTVLHTQLALGGRKAVSTLLNEWIKAERMRCRPGVPFLHTARFHSWNADVWPLLHPEQVLLNRQWRTAGVSPRAAFQAAKTRWFWTWEWPIWWTRPLLWSLAATVLTRLHVEHVMIP